MRFRWMFETLILANLAACGAFNSERGRRQIQKTAGDLTEVTALANGSQLEVSGLSGDGDIFNENTEMARNTVTYRAYDLTKNGHYYVVYVAQKPGISAAVGGEFFNEDGFGPAGALYGRLASVSLPVSGSAVYQGDFVALLQSSTTNFSAGVLGDVTLTAGFAEMLVEGSIVTRPLGDANVPGLVFDIDLEPTSIASSGLFQGAASARGSSSLSGTYEGLFAGPNAEQIAGALFMMNDDGTLKMTGVFTLD